MSTDGQPHVLAIGGGTFIPDDRYGLIPSPLIRYAIELTGQDRPRLCFLATAMGDGTDITARMYGAFSRLDAEVSHLALFPMPNIADVREHLLSQDLVYVSGGSVANLLALWRLHGLDEIFLETWRSGVVLAGQSAGALCWHVGGNTDSYGPELQPLTNGLGFLPYSCGVHYDAEEQRRSLLHRLVGDGTLPAGYAAEEDVALHYVGTEFVQAVTYHKGQGAYQIVPDGSGGAKETRIEPRLLSG